MILNFFLFQILLLKMGQHLLCYPICQSVWNLFFHSVIQIFVHPFSYLSVYSFHQIASHPSVHSPSSILHKIVLRFSEKEVRTCENCGGTLWTVILSSQSSEASWSMCALSSTPSPRPKQPGWSAPCWTCSWTWRQPRVRRWSSVWSASSGPRLRRGRSSDRRSRWVPVRPAVLLQLVFSDATFQVLLRWENKSILIVFEDYIFLKIWISLDFCSSEWCEYVQGRHFVWRACFTASTYCWIQIQYPMMEY